MIKGKVKAASGIIYSWELIPNNILTVRGFIIREINAQGITHSDQVIRLIDDEIEIIKVKEYQIEQGRWKAYK